MRRFGDRRQKDCLVMARRREALRVFLEHASDLVLTIRHSVPNKEWLDACRRCRGPEIFFAFFDGTQTEASLRLLLKKFGPHQRGRFVWGRRVLIVDDEVDEDECTVYIDRRSARPPFKRGVQHLILQGGVVVRSRGNTTLESLWLLDVETIAASAFEGCTNLSTLISNVTVVPSAAFRDCARLRTVHLPRCSKINDFAFACCSHLANLSLPNVASILRGAFFASIGLQNHLELPVLAHLGESAFEGTSLSSVSLPNLQTLGPSAFRGSITLSSVSIPRAFYIDPGAFCGCSNLDGRGTISDLVQDRLRRLWNNDVGTDDLL